jgi:hypothetical protein
VLKADTFAATPAMKAAIRPVTAIPSIPEGRYSTISAGMALLYVVAGVASLPKSLTVTSATSPGMITSAGMKILG